LWPNEFFDHPAPTDFSASCCALASRALQLEQSLSALAKPVAPARGSNMPSQPTREGF
jgi:hypothetical protein